jgi:hypothetical protein
MRVVPLPLIVSWSAPGPVIRSGPEIVIDEVNVMAPVTPEKEMALGPGAEFAWARLWLRKVRTRTAEMIEVIKRNSPFNRSNGGK